MLSERSSKKKAFMPSCGCFHCNPAIASISASTMAIRSPNAVQRRHALICTSDFTASHMVQGTAISSRYSHPGLVNWKFIALVRGSRSVVRGRELGAHVLSLQSHLRRILIGLWDDLRSLRPHPDPVPQGEGTASGRFQWCEGTLGKIQLRCVREAADRFPSPWGRG